MLSKEQIRFLNQVCPNRWSHVNGVINVEDDVNVSRMDLTQIPIQFYQINGHFDCSENKLTTLENSPSIIYGYFCCDSNQLTSLEGGPKYVGTTYSCEKNILTNLIGVPEICNGHFWCQINLLKSLEGCPRVIKGDLYCINNPNLKYLWSIGHVDGGVFYDARNNLNEWICSCMKRNIIFPYVTLEENVNWIKREQKYSCLLDAPDEIRQHFSSKILHLADFGIC